MEIVYLPHGFRIGDCRDIWDGEGWYSCMVLDWGGNDYTGRCSNAEIHIIWLTQ